MGLFQTYLVYKYGKRRAEKNQKLDDEFWSDVCEHCGYERRQHSRDEYEDCPTY